MSLIVPISENSGDSVTAQLLGHLNLILSFHAFLTVKKNLPSNGLLVSALLQMKHVQAVPMFYCDIIRLSFR